MKVIALLFTFVVNFCINTIQKKIKDDYQSNWNEDLSSYDYDGMKNEGFDTLLLLRV